MSWNLVSKGSVVTGFNATLTPPLPSYSVGQMFVLYAASYIGSLTPPSIPGWLNVAPGANVTQGAIYIAIATAGMSSPSVTYGNQQVETWIECWAGGPSTLTGIVHASADKTNNATNFIAYPALTITQPNCLVLALGLKDKTSTSDALTFGTLANFSQSTSYVHAGSSLASVSNNWVQTTATSLSIETQSMSVADSNLPYAGILVALLPGTGQAITMSIQTGIFSTQPESVALTASPIGTVTTLNIATGVFAVAVAAVTSDLEVDVSAGAFGVKPGNFGTMKTVGGLPAPPTNPAPQSSVGLDVSVTLGLGD